MKTFKIYKAGDPKDDETVCLISAQGVYIDWVERGKWNWNKEIDDYENNRRAHINYILDLNGSKPTGTRLGDCMHTQVPTTGPSSGIMRIRLLSNDGLTFRVKRDSALIRMSEYLNKTFSVSILNSFLICWLLQTRKLKRTHLVEKWGVLKMLTATKRHTN